MPYFEDNAALFKSPIHNKINVLRAGIVWSIASIIIFCVLFSGLLVSPAFGQEAKGLNNIVPLKIGDVVPDSLWYHRMPLYKGVDLIDTVCLADYAAEDKVLIIDFWPTWCSSCIESLLHLDSIIANRRYKNIEFISINVIDTEHSYRSFVARTGFGIPTLYDFSFLVNRMLTRYNGYYGILMIKGNEILGAPDKRTLTIENLDLVEQRRWDEVSIAYWPEKKKIEFANELVKEVGR